MKTYSILILMVFAMFGCKQGSESAENNVLVPFNKVVCSEAITAVTKLNGKSPIEVASKLVELTSQDPASIKETSSCLDENLKITCNQAKCLVAKKDF